MDNITRRRFIQGTLATGSMAAMLTGCSGAGRTQAGKGPAKEMRFGLVTYLWAQDWDVPTIIANCEKTNVLGVELRTEHAHGVEPELTKAERSHIRKLFKNSPVTLLGPGTNQQFDSPDPAKLAASIERTKAFIKLSHDIGASGVKVKPNQLHPSVPPQKTLEQIGRSLNQLGAFAADYGQEIRLEVHGKKTCELPNIKTIMDFAPHPNVGVCWNCNDQDLIGEGLEYNFNLVKDRLSQTTHVRELNIGDYPYQKLIDLFVEMDYTGWVLLEARTKPKDRVIALADQRKVWDQILAKAKNNKKV